MKTPENAEIRKAIRILEKRNEKRAKKIKKLEKLKALYDADQKKIESLKNIIQTVDSEKDGANVFDSCGKIVTKKLINLLNKKEAALLYEKKDGNRRWIRASRIPIVEEAKRRNSSTKSKIPEDAIYVVDMDDGTFKKLFVNKIYSVEVNPGAIF